MSKHTLATGVAHSIPSDIRRAILLRTQTKDAWNSLTPLARNEWICWTISVKTPRVRTEHITRLISDLTRGKRRPCCWIGCTHRTNKPMSPSQKGILEKKRIK